MSEEQWIIVPGWDKFQHYKDRTPTWIKLYTELASDADFLGLTDAARGLLVLIWIEHARSRGVNSVASMSRLGHNRGRTRSLNSLVEAGFIELSASKPLARVYQDASPEKEKEKKGAPARSRARASGAPSDQKLSQYAMAEAMTRNIGVQYTPTSFREELDRFDLDTNERDLLEELRAGLLNGTTTQEDDLF